jgi:hypothetical protein
MLGSSKGLKAVKEVKYYLGKESECENGGSGTLYRSC